MIKRGYILSIFLYLCITGCAPLIIFGAGTAAGIAGYKYYDGSLTVIYEAQYMKTWEATLRSVERMEFEIKSQKHDLAKGKIKGLMSDKRSIDISLKYKSAQQTEVIIRVGLLGDKNASSVIEESIRKELFAG